MIGAVVALALVGTPVDPLTARIAQSEAAAQALQGPFDGAWTLRDRAGVVFVFQMSDPPGSTAAVNGAWRDGTGGMGTAEFVREGARRLRIAVESSTIATVILLKNARGVWRGALPGHGVVTLTRGLATPPPPV